VGHLAPKFKLNVKVAWSDISSDSLFCIGVIVVVEVSVAVLVVVLLLFFCALFSSRLETSNSGGPRSFLPPFLAGKGIGAHRACKLIRELLDNQIKYLKCELKSFGSNVRHR
jgi:hypothetical protein